MYIILTMLHVVPPSYGLKTVGDVIRIRFICQSILFVSEHQFSALYTFYNIYIAKVIESILYYTK